MNERCQALNSDLVRCGSRKTHFVIYHGDGEIYDYGPPWFMGPKTVCVYLCKKHHPKETSN
jgi:hypothetical protein